MCYNAFGGFCMNNKIFKIKFGSGNCYFNNCNKETELTITICNHTFHVCKEHIDDLVKDVKDEYDNLINYLKAEENKKNELEKMRKELF